MEEYFFLYVYILGSEYSVVNQTTAKDPEKTLEVARLIEKSGIRYRVDRIINYPLFGPPSERRTMSIVDLERIVEEKAKAEKPKS